MLTLVLKYLALALVFLAVYALVLGLRPVTVEDLRFAWGRWVRRWSGGRPGRETVRTRALPPVLFTTCGGVLLGWVLGGADAGPGALLLAAAGGAAGLAAPRLWARLSATRRRRALEAQLPDALELLANSLRAGLSLSQAVEVAAKELPLPMVREFRSVAQDMRLGLSPEDALEKAAVHWTNADLELFVVAAQVARRTGGNLAETASQIVSTVRERFRLQGRISALTSQGILSGWVIGLLPVGVLVAMSLLDPELMNGFLRHPLGWGMLGVGALMELVGALFIRKIVRIDL